MSKLNAVDRDRARKLATDLATGFNWVHTLEGSKYWEDVYKKLCTLSEPPEKCPKCGQELPEK